MYMFVCIAARCLQAGRGHRAQVFRAPADTQRGQESTCKRKSTPTAEKHDHRHPVPVQTNFHPTYVHFRAQRAKPSVASPG
mmetsp:Transcript_93626/g.151174  ORF Transcript_93626/g.151174 Transcript_93626/m.151174 type:complete len:81 (-) Transcript_93626:1396-1638(-)